MLPGRSVVKQASKQGEGQRAIRTQGHQAPFRRGEATISSGTVGLLSDRNMPRASLLLLLATPPSHAATTIKLGLEWFLNPDHLPLVVALREGYFAEADLDVQLLEPADHWEAEEEILAGRLDVAVTETLHLAQDAARGKPVVGFSRFLHTDGGVLYLGSSNISRPSDMCGRTISYPGSPGPGGPAIVQTMVEADGGSCDLASYGKHNGGFYHVKALQDRAADVATLIFYNFEVIEAQQMGLRPGFFSLKEWGVPDFCQLVLFTTPQRLQALRPQLRKLVLAMRRATGLIKREPARAARIYEQHVKESAAAAAGAAAETNRSALAKAGAAIGGAAALLNPVAAMRRRKERKLEAAIFDATLAALPNDNSLSDAYFQGLMAWLVKTGQVDAQVGPKLPPEDYWTNEIAL